MPGAPRASRATALALNALAALAALAALSGTAAAHAAGAVEPHAYDRLLWLVLALGTVIGGLVFGLLLLGVWRYREGSDFPRRTPKEHDRRLESAWTAVPIAILVILTALSTQALIESETPPGDAMTIRAVGIQWQWVFTYPDGNTSVNDVWVEEGQHVIFEVTSLDVVHSFFLPEYNLKVDAFPNETYRTWIHADRVGDYDIFCAEFCGLEHGEMQGTLHVYARTTPSRPYGPPPDQQPPPPPPPSDVTVTLGVDGTGSQPPSITLSPAVLRLPLGANVTLVVRNNTTRELDLMIGPPYMLTLVEVDPEDDAALTFKADRPIAGGSIEVRVHEDGGEPATATLVVGSDPAAPPFEPEGGTEGSHAVAWALAGGAVLLLLCVLALALRPPRREAAAPTPAPEVPAGTGGDAHG